MNHTLFRAFCLVLPLGLLVSLGGCPPAGDGTGNSQLKVNFDAGGGNYAVATDKKGNQYTFRARQDPNGSTTVTEANILTPAGKQLKLSLDSSGRPVNVRLSDNTAADLVYDGENVNIRLTDATGHETASARTVKSGTMKDFVRARRLANFSKIEARSSAKLDTLQKGLETCEEVIVSVTDPATNPDSPLVDCPLTTGIQDIASVASTAEVEETASRDDLGSDVTVDELPAEVQALAGKTFKLFDAEGFCLEMTDVANRLTFDNNGVLQTEFDRHLVFPDFSLGGGQDPGITINYSSATPINLTPGEELGFSLIATPVFTGTQLDDNGHITIERRFNADLTFDVSLFGTATAEAHKLFDVAFINGVLSDTGEEQNALLELDLVLVDLEEQNPVATLGRLRYHDQNVRQPEQIYNCAVDIAAQTETDPERGIVCPTDPVQLGEDFEVTFNPGTGATTDLQFDWFISSGAGYIVGDPTAPDTTFRATENGFLELTLLVHDLSTTPETLSVYTCTVNVGQDPNSGANVPSSDELAGYCPTTMGVGVSADAWVEGPLLEQLDYLQWYVLGAMNYFIENPNAPRATITFYEAGTFEVVFEGWTSSGESVYLWQDVEVVTSGTTDYGGNQPPVQDLAAYVGTYAGELYEPVDWAHQIAFTIDAEGVVTGTSTWGTSEYSLAGYIDASGYLYMVDDADTLDLPLGIYEGQWDSTMDPQGFQGQYYEDDMSNLIGDWSAIPSGS